VTNNSYLTAGCVDDRRAEVGRRRPSDVGERRRRRRDIACEWLALRTNSIVTTR